MTVENDAAVAQATTAAKIDHRREVVRQLGLRVELGQDNIGRYADAVFCFANKHPKLTRYV